jgi:hypothetical protein
MESGRKATGASEKNGRFFARIVADRSLRKRHAAIVGVPIGNVNPALQNPRVPAGSASASFP